MAWQSQIVPWKTVDGISLASSATISADGVAGSAAFVGRGAFFVEITAQLTDTGVGFDVGLIIIQANTLAATSTWVEIGNLCLGDTTGTGRSLTSVTTVVVGVLNQGDNQIRMFVYVQGSTTIMTITAKAYPAMRKE